MRVLMGGASGLVGKSLSECLIRHKCPVVKLVRRPVTNDITEIFWDPEKGELDESKLEEFDVIIHLGGFNVAKKVWTSRVKKKILESRVKSTQLLADKISKLKNKPKIFLVASGMNIYGYTKKDEEPFTESSKASGDDFLADVVKEWEAAANSASSSGVRVVNARFSAVIGKDGGLLKKMLPVFRMAAGGRLGKGNQVMTWVDVDDAVGIIWHCLQQESISGPVNICSPNPVTNKEFTKGLSKAVGLPAFLPMPVFVIKTVFAEMGEVLMLSSIKCASSKLDEYEFKFPTIRESLNNQLGVSVEADDSLNVEEAGKEDENPA